MLLASSDGFLQNAKRDSQTLSFGGKIYIYKILFNPVNSELGTILSKTNKIFKNRILNLSNPG